MDSHVARTALLFLGMGAFGCAQGNGNVGGAGGAGLASTGTDAASASAAGSTSSVTTTAGSSTSGSATGSSNASTTVGSSSSTGSGGPLVGSPTSIVCGSTTCAIPGDICCMVGPQISPTYSCSATGTTCPIVAPGPTPGSAALACLDASNCGPGTSCCLDVVNGQAVSACLPSCAASKGQLCNWLLVDDGCSISLPCSKANINEFGLPSTFATCGGVKN